ncbi:MAG TPA: hypothetical protein VFP39_03640 [Gemmatimonadales bacterium]|nr:hypothetical protein [Gemmatimonadales bacterium]
MEFPRAILAAAGARGALTRGGTFALAALLVASALAVWGVTAYRKNQQHKAVAVLVRDSSERLEAALALNPEGASPQTVAKLDEQAQEVDKHLIELRDTSASSDRALGAAAEEYLLTVRQILREQAASHRYGIQVAATEGKLREHMRGAARRSKAWIDEAVSAKDRMERSYFDYRVSSEALDRLLASYPPTRKKMAAQLRAPLASDEAVEAARKRIAAASKRVGAGVEQARQLAAVR